MLFRSVSQSRYASYFGHSIASATDNPLVYKTSQTVNILPLLAYQKIYYDFFSESQWEKHLAYAYNVDYWDGKSQLTLAPEMLQLRYANYPKDYFMGMLPSSQYGSVAVLPSSYQPALSPERIVTNTPSSSAGSSSYLINPASGTSVVTNTPNPSSSSALVVRLIS